MMRQANRGVETVWGSVMSMNPAVHVVKGIRCCSEILRFYWRKSCREKMNFGGRWRKSHGVGRARDVCLLIREVFVANADAFHNKVREESPRWHCVEEREVAGGEVCPEELADEAVELTADELTTVGAVDFSETIGGRSLLVSTSVYIAVQGRCVRRRQLSSKGGMDGTDRC